VIVRNLARVRQRGWIGAERGQAPPDAAERTGRQRYLTGPAARIAGSAERGLTGYRIMCGQIAGCRVTGDE